MTLLTYSECPAVRPAVLNTFPRAASVISPRVPLAVPPGREYDSPQEREVCFISAPNFVLPVDKSQAGSRELVIRLILST